MRHAQTPTQAKWSLVMRQGHPLCRPAAAATNEASHNRRSRREQGAEKRQLEAQIEVPRNLQKR